MTNQSPSNQEPIGIPVTPLIEQHMARLNDKAMPLLEHFGASALCVAITQSQNHGRGMILGVESPRSKKFLYVKQSDCATALWMVAVDMKRKVADALKQYSPESEAVVIMVVPPTAQLFLASQENQMKMIEIQPVEQTVFTMPPGVSSRKEQKGQTFYYSYIHKTLGSLGRLVLRPVTSSQMNITYEVASPKGFEDSRNQQKRLDIFLPLAQELIARLELGLMR
jgi:hypothetical protein